MKHYDLLLEISTNKKIINSMHKIAYNIVGRDRVEEAVSQTILKIANNTEKFDEEKASLNTWACTITRNESLLLKHNESIKGVSRGVQFNDSENCFYELPNSKFEYNHDIDSLAKKIEEIANLSPALNRHNLTDIFISYYRNESDEYDSYDKISKETGLSINTLKSIFRRAKYEISKGIDLSKYSV